MDAQDNYTLLVFLLYSFKSFLKCITLSKDHSIDSIINVIKYNILITGHLSLLNQNSIYTVVKKGNPELYDPADTCPTHGR